MTKKHKVQDYAGISGHFFIQKRDASGRSEPATYEESKNLPIVYEKEIHNKVLKRGLSYMFYSMFWRNTSGAGSGWYFYDDITNNPTTNPFQYFILSQSTTRPDWNESNGSNNGNAGPQGNGTPNLGTRGIAVSDTSGIFYRVSISQYTSPYKTMEIVFFAQDNPAAAQESGAWDAIDNFSFSCMGFAEGVDAGNGGVDSRWGLRSLIGLAPMFQGVTDRVNVAEATPGTLVVNPTDTLSDGYVQDSNQDGYEGEHAFDGDYTAEGTTGTVDLGDTWRSDAGASHHIGRVWTTDQTITHFRVTIPAGVNVNNVPKYFKAQELTGSDPSNNSHWTDISLTVDTHLVDQSGNIYSAGDQGYEYELSSPTTTKGFRLYEIEPVDPTSFVSIGELYICTAMSAVTISSGNNVIRLSIDGGSNWREFTLPDTGSTTDVQDLVDALNSQILGYEMEAVRSEFGFLWIRGTTQGAVSTLDLDTTGNGSTANSDLGLNTSGDTDTGTTETITKGQNETLTIIYRMDIGLQEGINA